MSFLILAIVALPLGVVAFVFEFVAGLIFSRRGAILQGVPYLLVFLLYAAVPTVTFGLGVAYLSEPRSSIGWALAVAVPLTVFDALWDLLKIRRLEKPRREEIKQWEREHKVRRLTAQELQDMKKGKSLVRQP
jgi:hypothetical protein